MSKALRCLPLLLLLASAASQSAVLPEDRADIMYHRYSGGGITVQGPSVLVRKNFGESVSGPLFFSRRTGWTAKPGAPGSK